MISDQIWFNEAASAAFDGESNGEAKCSIYWSKAEVEQYLPSTNRGLLTSEVQDLRIDVALGREKVAFAIFRLQ